MDGALCRRRVGGRIQAAHGQAGRRGTAAAIRARHVRPAHEPVPHRGKQRGRGDGRGLRRGARVERMLADHGVAHGVKHSPRRVLYNSWEATQFDVRADAQMRLAERAARMGVELFVVDDGWFGARHSDRAGLGDWTVNPEKFPNGLEELIDRFGEPGKAVLNLLAIARLKALAHQGYVTEIKQLGKDVRITLYEKAKLDPAGIPAIMAQYRRGLQFKADHEPKFILTPQGRLIEELMKFAGELAKLAEPLE